MNIPELVTAQRAFYQSGATQSMAFRQTQLEKLRRGIETREAELLEALGADVGKPRLEAFLSEIGFVLSQIRHAQRRLRRWMKPRRAKVPPIAWPGRARVRPEPRGVVLIMGPWNYPAQLILAPLAAAIAAGNCAVLKPSEFAPATSRVLTAFVRDTFSPDFVGAVEGDHTVAEALLRERFDHIFFTGSSSTGRKVMAAASAHLTPVTLELGGKSPCIVCADAPLEITARRIIWGKCINAGQTCVAPDYVLADRRIRNPLVEEMRKALHRFFGDDPRLSADYGRIVNQSHFERLAALLGSGRILHGGERDAASRYFSPTLLGNVARDSPVMENEIFGPILPILEFDELDEALRFIRARPDPLALYVFTGSRATMDRVEAETQSGGLCCNDTLVHLSCKSLPFGGRGESGMGSYHGKSGFDCFSHEKAVLRRSFRFDSPLRYPPVKTSLTTIKRVLHFLLGR